MSREGLTQERTLKRTKASLKKGTHMGLSAIQGFPQWICVWFPLSSIPGQNAFTVKEKTRNAWRVLEFSDPGVGFRVNGFLGLLERPRRAEKWRAEVDPEHISVAVGGVWAGCMASLAAVSMAKAREVGSRRMYLCVLCVFGGTIFGPG